MSQQAIIPEAKPAATVVLIRDGKQGLETLLLKPNQALLFAGGFWVFPGGSIDQADMAAAANDIEQAARLAAIREAVEEANIAPDIQRMVKISHWTTPTAEARRFATWFYVAACPAGAVVQIDNGEIHDSRWIGVQQAVSHQDAGELPMLPPTYLTLCQLARMPSVEAALSHIGHAPSPSLLPVFSVDGEDLAVLFNGDAGYRSANANEHGARHRAVLKNNIWRYYCDTIEGVKALDGRSL